MVIKGYDSSYLETAMKNLGEAFDYAKNSCRLDMDKFMDMFISSGYSKLFENGNVKVLVGMSGSELALNVFEKCGYLAEIKPTQNKLDYSPQYWCGWILAYYQWKTELSFKYIHSQITMPEILQLYPTLHEAHENKFVDIINKRIKNKVKTTRLQQMRKNCGLSQKELSTKSGVNLRTLQQYELGAKDINKASTSSVLALAKVLSCEVEDLLEMIWL